MEKNRLLALVALVIGFVALAVVQATAFGGKHEFWHLFEILTVLTAAIYYVPGAIGGTAVAVIVGLMYVPVNSDMILNYVRLGITAGIIGWFAARQHLQQEYLGRLLMVDRLTGLHNYSYFIDRLDEERKRADRFGSRLSMIMIDIDHFKPYNDKFGHQKGNDMLKHVAEIFKIQVRGVDIVSRYGGEEFAVLLPNTGRTAAEEVAERIRAAVEESDFAVTSETEKRTVSLGVATYPDDAEDDLRLIDRADEALYKAKEAGRNRVVVYGLHATKQEAIS